MYNLFSVEVIQLQNDPQNEDPRLFPLFRPRRDPFPLRFVAITNLQVMSGVSPLW
jgi:hypothetical protein